MTKKIIIALISLTLLICLVISNALLINPKQISIREEVIESAKIDKDLDGLIIVYFSDLYFGNYIDETYLDMLVEKINLFNPDVVIFGGDLVADTYVLDGASKELLLNTLSAINYKYGKYAVLGEQDLCSENNAEEISELLQNSDFTVLNNEVAKVLVDINSHINIVGFASMYKGDPDYSVLNQVDGFYTITVTHCPDSFSDFSAYDFDYCLAGHSLGGQIYFPLINLLNREYGYQAYIKGKHTSNNKTLDITNGLGFKGSKARLNADSEIVVYKLKQKN